MKGIEFAVKLFELGISAVRGETPSVAQVLDVFSALAAFVPVDELAPFLDEQARRRADAIADAAERVKLGD